MEEGYFGNLRILQRLRGAKRFWHSSCRFLLALHEQVKGGAETPARSVASEGSTVNTCETITNTDYCLARDASDRWLRDKQSYNQEW